MDSPSPAAAPRAGWMEKRGNGALGFAWRRRWFVLDGECAHYYEAPNSPEPKGSISLRRARVGLVPAGPGQRVRFELRVESPLDCRTFELAFATEEEQRGWHAALGDAALACLAQVAQLPRDFHGAPRVLCRSGSEWREERREINCWEGMRWDRE